MFIVGPPTSASPRPPEETIEISAAFPMSGMYADTPAPLNAEPTLNPSSWRRPSLPRPPAPPNTTMPGTVCASEAAPPAATALGISVIRLLYAREVGNALIMSLFMTVCSRTLWTSTIGVSPVTVTVSSSVPTFISPLTVATKAPVSSMPSRLTVPNPGT